MLAFLLFAVFFAASALLLFLLANPQAKEAKETRSRLDLIGSMQPQSVEVAASLRHAENLSGIAWLDRILVRMQVAESLKLLLRQADLSWSVGRLVLTAAVSTLAAALLVYLRVGEALISILIGGLAGFIPFGYVLHLRRARFRRMRQHLPEALDHMAAAIRAGHSFSSAMGMAAKESPEPVRREFRQCFDEQNFGLELRFALMNLARRVPLHDIRVMITAVLIQNETGGNLTEILDKVGSLIRQDFQLQKQVDIHTVQGRLTGWILSLLPVVLGTLLYLVNPKNMSLLWTRSEGRKLLLAGTIMTTVGALIIRRVIKIRV